MVITLKSYLFFYYFLTCWHIKKYKDFCVYTNTFFTYIDIYMDSK